MRMTTYGYGKTVGCMSEDRGHKGSLLNNSCVTFRKSLLSQDIVIPVLGLNPDLTPY